MDENQDSYDQVFRATALFSGVRIFSIIISIIKSKFAAIFIGSAGIGVLGVLTSTLNLIIGFSKLGLDVSAVKELSSALGDKKNDQVQRVTCVLKRLIWITGLFGALITMVFSNWLSKIAFGNADYWFSFFLIAIAVFFNQITIGNLALLQGFRKLRLLANATLYGSFFGLIITIPLYYFYGVKGIVPVIILTSVITYCFSWYFIKSLKIKKEKISIKEVFIEGKQMVKLGFVLSMGSLATLLFAFFIQIFITNYGGVSQVGYYNAGFVLINTYVGVIFNAMSQEYFPRLVANVKQKDSMNKMVNQQSFVIVLLITPLIIVFIPLVSVIIKVLYAKEFLPIVGMVTFGVIANLFKAVSWALGYIIVAKGDSKLYFFTEITFNFILFIISALGYIYGGLMGIGIGYLLYYIIYLFGVKLIATKKYDFKFNVEFSEVFIICIMFCILTFLTTYIYNIWLRYCLMVIMIISSCVFTIFKLNKKINLLDTIKGLFLKNKKN